MKTIWLAPALFVLAHCAQGTVQVFVQESNGLANINYQCTAGEVVRDFALDVTLDRGQFVGVTNFFRGPSTTSAQGYGIFPAALRDFVTVSSGSNANWTVAGYTPLAVPTDAPGGTLPGLNSAGVTLEFGAIWDPSVPAAAPPPSGTLCALRISQSANVTISANFARGGIIASPPDFAIASQFTAALVGPAITGINVTNGTATIQFQSGELESAPALEGPWTGTGNTNGIFSEEVNTSPAKFYRVHQH